MSKNNYHEPTKRELAEDISKMLEVPENEVAEMCFQLAKMNKKNLNWLHFYLLEKFKPVEKSDHFDYDKNGAMKGVK